MNTQWRKLQIITFSKKCCPNATRRRQAAGCAFSERKLSTAITPTLSHDAGRQRRCSAAHRIKIT
jgi:hypothetical protein